jgi:predicted ABC-type transport system involved in lysophospholipase L1 biosynthesis ATPase subunit
MSAHRDSKTPADVHQNAQTPAHADRDAQTPMSAHRNSQTPAHRDSQAHPHRDAQTPAHRRVAPEAAGPPALLQLSGVSRRLRDGARELTVLDRVGLHVHAGELVGVYGERRSGKSTLLRITAGLEAPDAGTVRFDGVDLAGLSLRARARLRRRGGLALARGDCGPLAGGQPVLEHVALPLTGDGLTLSESEGLARPVLEQVGVAALAHLRVDLLSLSDRVRVELARALVREPRLLLVDEPAVLPGPRDSRELQALLLALAREQGVSVVIASQDMAALAGVQRFLTLSDGRLRSAEGRRRVIPFPSERLERRVG